MFNSSYGFWPFSILSAFAGIISVIIFCHWFSINIVKYIGKNSLIYFAWHQTIFIPIVRILFLYVGINCNEFDSYFSMLVERILELVVMIIILTSLNIVINKSKLRFMIGK